MFRCKEKPAEVLLGWGVGSDTKNMPPACGRHRRACRPNRCTLHTTGGLRTDEQLGRVCGQRF